MSKVFQIASSVVVLLSVVVTCFFGILLVVAAVADIYGWKSTGAGFFLSVMGGSGGVLLTIGSILWIVEYLLGRIVAQPQGGRHEDHECDPARTD